MSIGIGMAITTEFNALIIHAIVAFIIATVVSFVYFKKFKYTTPLKTAIIFVLFIILIDFFVVSLLIIKSFEMFESLIGTWIPFALIFVTTYLIGRYLTK
jgi:hypothetical protein